jgi:alpha-glucoside transport system substrate-binding protein
MQNKRYLGLALTAMLAVGACANEAASTAPSAAPSTAPASSAPSAAVSEAPSGPNAELTAALAGEYTGTNIDVLAQWIEAEGTAFDDSLKAFRDATGINVVYSGITNYETVLSVRVEGGLAPDIAQLAQPGRMRNYQEAGKLVELESILDAATVRADFGEGFIADSSVDGKLFGLYYSQNFKSIVWYPKAAFETAGYAIPTTWDELETLEADIKADGGAPWCTTIEHGDVSGWVATDEEWDGVAAIWTILRFNLWAR